MIRKLTGKQVGKLSEAKIDSLEKVTVGGEGIPDMPGAVHDLLCSSKCEDYCGIKPGSDGIMWVGQRDFI